MRCEGVGEGEWLWESRMGPKVKVKANTVVVRDGASDELEARWGGSRWGWLLRCLRRGSRAGLRLGLRLALRLWM